ncbi:MAG: CDP-alcohol phosphatidyltransferase family protein [Xanthomonadales bacterium]
MKLSNTMITHALVIEESPVELWGLSARERIRRQLQAIGGVELLESGSEIPTSGRVLLLNGHFLFEIRTFAGLLQRQNTVLSYPGDGRPAAVIADFDLASSCEDYITGRTDTPPDKLAYITADDLAAFDQALLSAKTPLLEPVLVGKKQEIENLLYGNAYKGITDLVTKFVWPRPARTAVHAAANLGLSPNMVTGVGLVLVIAACYLFLHGHYLAGLAAGWIMTFLDTVDGKLARVTVQSSKFGHLFDHLIDLFHPPFWYIFWGMSLLELQSVMGFEQGDMYWIIVIGYVAGRLVEGMFPLLGNCNVFTWKPFDAYFRLFTARRNPCLIILTVSAIIGRPDWGFIVVTCWTVLSTMVLFVRLLQGVVSRLKQGPLESWLNADSVAQGPNARAFRLFGSTRGAYGD